MEAIHENGYTEGEERRLGKHTRPRRRSQIFLGLLRDMDKLRNIRFPRCLSPLDGQFEKPAPVGVRRRVQRDMLLAGLSELEKG
jgi:hypothetical protein